MKIEMLDNWILLERGEAEGKTPGGIILPDRAKDKPRVGVVRHVGPGKYTKDGMFLQTKTKPGQRVLFKTFGASDVRLGGTDYLVMSEEDVLAILGPEES